MSEISLALKKKLLADNLGLEIWIDSTEQVVYRKKNNVYERYSVSLEKWILNLNPIPKLIPLQCFKTFEELKLESESNEYSKT